MGLPDDSNSVHVGAPEDLSQLPSRLENWRINTVEVSLQRLNDTATGLLARCLGKGHCRITCLALNGAHLDDEALLTFAEQLLLTPPPSLTKLDISSCSFSDHGLNAVTAALAGARSFRELVLSDDGLTRHAGVCLGKSLRGDNPIEILNVSHNKLGDCGVAALGGALAADTRGTTPGSPERSLSNSLGRGIRDMNLRVLDLSANQLADSGAIALCKGLSSLISLNKSYGCTGSNLCTLRTLILEGNEISDGGAQALGNLLASGDFLEELNVANNLIGPIGAESLSVAIGSCSSIRALNISGAGVDADALAALASSLCEWSECSSLTRLNAAPGGQPIISSETGEALEALASALSTSTTLVELELGAYRECFMQQVGATTIERVIKMNRRLVEITPPVSPAVSAVRQGQEPVPPSSKTQRSVEDSVNESKGKVLAMHAEHSNTLRALGNEIEELLTPSPKTADGLDGAAAKKEIEAATAVQGRRLERQGSAEDIEAKALAQAVDLRSQIYDTPAETATPGLTEMDTASEGHVFTLDKVKKVAEEAARLAVTVARQHWEGELAEVVQALQADAQQRVNESALKLTQEMSWSMQEIQAHTEKACSELRVELEERKDNAAPSGSVASALDKLNFRIDSTLGDLGQRLKAVCGRVDEFDEKRQQAHDDRVATCVDMERLEGFCQELAGRLRSLEANVIKEQETSLHMLEAVLANGAKKVREEQDLLRTQRRNSEASMASAGASEMRGLSAGR